MSGRNKQSRLVVLAALLAFLASCATREPVPEPPIESYLLTVYSNWFAADVAGSIDLYEYVLSELDAGLAGTINRVERISGGLRLQRGGPPEVSAVARGSFPKGGFQFALATNRSFERKTADIGGSREVYFTEREGLLQLAVPRSGLLYLSNGLLLDMLPDRPSAEFDMDRDVYESLVAVGEEGQPDAKVIFADPARQLLSTLGLSAPNFPLQRIDLNVTTDGDGLRFGGELFLRSEVEAALFGRVGRFFVILFVRALGLDSPSVQNDVEIEVEGTTVAFSNIPMTRDELVAAVRSFTGGE